MLAVAIGCGGLSRTAPQSLDAAAERYVRLTLALAERDGDSLDSYHGPRAWQADARARHASLADIKSEARALAGTLAASTAAISVEDDERRLFLLRQLRALAARVDILLGSRPGFAEEARSLFDFDAAAIDGGDAVAIRAEVDRLLPGRGTVADRYAAFDRQFLVARDRIDAVLSRAIEGCRGAASAHLTLPPGERVVVDYVGELPWSAFTRYEGRAVSRIRVNAALPLTVDRALDLACHEAYPGHHAIDTLLDARWPDRVEFLVRPLFSPQAMLHEAAASLAPSLAFSDSGRLAFERDVLFPIAALDPAGADLHVRVGRLVDRLAGAQAAVARQYLDGALDFPRAAAALEHDALMPSADATLKFLNQFRSYAATYTLGRERLHRHLDATAGADQAARWRAFRDLVTSPAQNLPPEPRHP